MAAGEFDVVTGAFSYTGRYIARELMARGRRVRTLTGHPENAAMLREQVEAAPYDFERPDELARTLDGCATVFNTYWVRFPRGGTGFDTAIANTKILLRAGARAGVRKVVHISVTHATTELPLPYFRGKGQVEKLVAESGIRHAIIRPALIFGVEDILLNNIAWMLRRFPIFAIAGSGEYRAQPIFAGDLARLAADAAEAPGDAIFDAIGPETYTFNELVQSLAAAVRSKSRIVHLSPQLAILCAEAIGWITRDVTLTRDELGGLMANLLTSEAPPNAETRFSQWLGRNAGQVGVRYASELARHFRRGAVRPRA